MALSLKKSIFAILGSAALIFVASAGVFVFGLHKNDQRILRAVANAEKLMREDTYGGSTPEETFAMFLDALRAGDTDLASRYFVLSKQEEWQANLQKIKNSSQLSAMAEDLTQATKRWKREDLANTLVNYTYGVEAEAKTITLPNGQSHTFPKGTYQQQISFFKNTSSGKWKISQL